MKIDHKKDINPKYLLLVLSVFCILLIVLSYFYGSIFKPVRAYTMNLITPMQKGVNNIGIWINEKIDVFYDNQKLKAENDELKKQVSNYENELSRYQSELTELQELRELYKLDELYPEYNTVAARVFSADSSGWFGEFYIDKGLNDGIYENCNVICDNGLLGIVEESYSDHAKVRAIIDDRSNVTCEISPSASLCNVEGNLTAISNGYLLVTDIDKDAEINEGDKVITSSVSDRYFYGITVGYIYEITYDSNNLTKTAKLTPAVDFSEIRDVLIITDRKQEVTY